MRAYPYSNRGIVLALILLSMSQALFAASERSQTRKLAESDLEYYSAIIEKIDKGGGTCDIGVLSSWDNTITRVSEAGMTSGLRPGDKLLELGGEQVDAANRISLLAQYDPGEEVTMVVGRDNESYEFPVVCGDNTDTDKANIQMVRDAAAGRWQDCVDSSVRVDQVRGLQTAFTAHYALYCSESERCGMFRCDQPTRQDAWRWYEPRARSIEEAFYVEGKLDSIRAEVMDIVGILEKEGYFRMAADLESRLLSAEAGNYPSGLSAGAPIEPVLAPPISAVDEPVQPARARAAYGSCFAVSESEVLTNYSVVADANLITVAFQDGREIGAVTLEHSQSTDLALLRISATTPTILPMAPMRSLEPGEQILAAGYPDSGPASAASVLEGFVVETSGKDGDAGRFRTSVPVERGYEGGPIVNLRGEVVGIVVPNRDQTISATKSDYARPLFDVPVIEERASTRSEAAQMTLSAVCKVSAVTH